MRPLTLTMTAFGPYAETVHLDFADLKNQSLFLITGPTGAGKTSILDAMVFALFGESSGGLREGTTMRSDYASEETLTEVCFTFAVGDNCYKITRSPKQKVKKKRGEGYREQAAVAHLSVLEDGTWREFSSRSNEIKEKIDEIIGFRLDQFLQVVLLPQGEFRKLLVAKTAEREALMHTLFNTAIYTRLQDLLKEEYEKVSKSSEDVLNRQRYLLSGEDVVTETDLCEKAAAAKVAQTEATVVLIEAHKTQQRIVNDYELGEKRRSLTAVIAEKRAVLTEFMKESAAIEATRKTLARLEQIAPILQKEMQQQQLIAKVKQIDADLQTAFKLKDDLVTEGKTLAEQKASLAERKPLSETYRLDINKASDIQKHFDAIASIQQDIAKLAEQAKAAKAGLQAQNALLTEKTEEVNILAQSLTSLQTEIAGQSSLMNDWEAVIGAVQLGQQAVKLLTDRETAKLRDSNARHAYEQAKQAEELALSERNHREYLREQYAAAGLAGALKEHTPCPVCGSKEHPHKATWPEDYKEDDVAKAEKAYNDAIKLTSKQAERKVTTATQLKEAEEAVIKSSQAVTEWLANHRGLGIQTAEANAFLGEAETAKTILDNRRKTLAIKETKAQQLNKEVTEINKGMEILRHALQQKEEQHQQTLHALSGKRSALELHQEAVKEIDRASWEKELQQKIQWLTSYDNEKAGFDETERDFLQRQSSNSTNIINWQKQERETNSELADVAQFISEELTKCQLTDEDVADLRLKVADKSSLSTQVHDFDTAVNRENTLLKAADEELQALAEPTEAVTLEMKEAATAAYEEAVRQETLASEVVRHLDEVLTEYAKLVADNKAIMERVDFIFKLHDLASGGNSGQKGVTFERYVLGASLEEVVVAANVRLRQMSRGRYELLRARVESVSRGHRGLDLSVLDTYTGYERPANTLSGGETFLASLSLAMGLADIIQAYAGGIHLDTIFIDEGFGTLDPDTLDIAMETFVELQKSGRLVGIISHVPELKGRIQAHLEVEATNRGSTAHFMVP